MLEPLQNLKWTLVLKNGKKSTGYFVTFIIVNGIHGTIYPTASAADFAFCPEDNFSEFNHDKQSRFK